MRHGGFEPAICMLKTPYFQGFALFVDQFVDNIKGRIPKDTPLFLI